MVRKVRKARVLIVEDDPVVRELLRTVFAYENYEAIAEANGVQLVTEANIVNECLQPSSAWNPVLPCIPPSGPPVCPNNQ